MKKIAIIGATGMLGQPVTHAFIQAGFAVSVLARNRAKAERLFGTGVTVTEGDLSNPDLLPAFLHGHEHLYLNLSVDPASSPKRFQPEREGLHHILAAARTAGIRRIGYLSSLVQFYRQTNGWMLELKRNAVASIRQSGLDYLVFYPSTFMESFDKGAYRQGNRLNLAGTSHHRMYLIAGADYARQVVSAFGLDNGSQEYVVQGPEGFTADEGARLFAAHYTKARLTVVKVPFGVLRLLGLFSRRFDYGAQIVEALNNYPETFVAGKTWQELGKPRISFLEYIRTA